MPSTSRRQTQWQTPTCTFDGRNKLDPSKAVDKGLLCRCQHQSLFNVGGHYNARLFKLSRPKRQRKFPHTFHCQRRHTEATGGTINGIKADKSSSAIGAAPSSTSNRAIQRPHASSIQKYRFAHTLVFQWRE